MFKPGDKVFSIAAGLVRLTGYDSGNCLLSDGVDSYNLHGMRNAYDKVPSLFTLEDAHKRGFISDSEYCLYAPPRVFIFHKLGKAVPVEVRSVGHPEELVEDFEKDGYKLVAVVDKATGVAL